MNILEKIERKALEIAYHYKELFGVNKDLFFIVLISWKEYKEFEELCKSKSIMIELIDNTQENNQRKITLTNNQCLNFFIVEIEEFIISGTRISSN